MRGQRENVCNVKSDVRSFSCLVVTDANGGPRELTPPLTCKIIKGFIIIICNPPLGPTNQTLLWVTAWAPIMFAEKLKNIKLPS